MQKEQRSLNLHNDNHVITLFNFIYWSFPFKTGRETLTRSTNNVNNCSTSFMPYFTYLLFRFFDVEGNTGIDTPVGSCTCCKRSLKSRASGQTIIQPFFSSIIKLPATPKFTLIFVTENSTYSLSHTSVDKNVMMNRAPRIRFMWCVLQIWVVCEAEMIGSFVCLV